MADETTITAEMVQDVIAVSRPAAQRMAVYANHRLSGLLPADARKETPVSMSTGSVYEKALRILRDRYDLPAPREPGRFEPPDYVAAGRAAAHQRWHVKRRVAVAGCEQCGGGEGRG